MKLSAWQGISQARCFSSAYTPQSFDKCLGSVCLAHPHCCLFKGNSLKGYKLHWTSACAIDSKLANSMVSIMPLPKRIRVKTPEDIERLYVLIVDFHEHPERAVGVTEFVFKRCTRQPQYLRKTNLPDEWSAKEAARPAPLTPLLWAVVERIGLSAEEQTECVKNLSWMDPELRATRETALEALERRFEVQPWVTHQDGLRTVRYSGATDHVPERRKIGVRISRTADVPTCTPTAARDDAPP